MKKSTQKTLVYIVAIAVVGYIVLQSGVIGGNVLMPNLNWTMPQITFPLPSSSPSSQPPTYEGPTYNPPDYTPPDYTPPSTSIKPSSLTIQVHPNPAEMGDWIWGQVVSDGKDYSVTVHAKLVGTGQEQSYSGLLGDDGKFEDGRQLFVPGYWDFWATADGVTSNTPRLTVEGVLIVVPIEHYSHTLGSPVTAQLYSHTSGNAQINAVDHDHGITTYLTNTVINVNGFGEILLDFGVLSSGNYEIEVLINGLDSSTYDGSSWLTVGR